MKHLSVLDILLFPPPPHSLISDLYPKQARDVYFPWELRTSEAEGIGLQMGGITPVFYKGSQVIRTLCLVSESKGRGAWVA